MPVPDKGPMAIPKNGPKISGIALVISKVPGAFTVTKFDRLIEPPDPMLKVPPLMVMPPLNVSAPVSVKVPVPLTVSPPVPLITPEYVVDMDSTTVKELAPIFVGPLPTKEPTVCELVAALMSKDPLTPIAKKPVGDEDKVPPSLITSSPFVIIVEPVYVPVP